MTFVTAGILKVSPDLVGLKSIIPYDRGQKEKLVQAYAEILEDKLLG